MHLHVGAFFVSLFVSLTAGQVEAEVLRLPVDRLLDEEQVPTQIAVELDHASLTLVVDPEAVPRLRARRRPQRRRPAAPQALEWRQTDTSLTLTRAGEAWAEAGSERKAGTIPIQVDLVVPSVEALRLEGSDLDLTVHDTSPAEERAGEEEPRLDGGDSAAAGRGTAAETPRLHLRVVRSDVTIQGVPGGRLVVTGGSLRLHGTRGEFSIRAKDAKTSVADHQGGLRVEGEAGELVLQDHTGELGLEIEGTHVVVRDSESRCHAQVEGGWIEFEGWRGRGEIQGRNTLIEVRLAGGRGTDTSLELEGRGLEVALDRYEGSLVARLEESSLRGSAVVGTTHVTARSQTTVDLTDLQGEETRLKLEGGARAHLAGVAGRLVAEVEDARLEAHRVENLNLLAERAEVSVAGLPRLGRATATDSRLDLDLMAIEHGPTLILKGASQARIHLPLPCEVRVVEPGEIGEERVEVSGCELLTLSRPGDRFDAQTRTEGAVKFIASVSERSSLVVRGWPSP